VGWAAADSLPTDILLPGGTLYGGNGAKATVGDVAIRAGKIVATGKVELTGMHRSAPVQGIAIVEEGKARAALAPLPRHAPLEVRRATDEFQRVLQKMTGTKLLAPNNNEGPIIHIGRDAFVDRAVPDFDRLDEDGFVIRTVEDRHLILAGRTPHATEFAVYRFLQKYGGVRWFFPTVLGEVIPRRTRFHVGALADCEAPSFHSRQWSSAAPFDGGTWERHNLCRARYNFHHNLLHIFVPSKIYATHPEWFPEINGKRQRPRDDNDHGWQPCLANREAAQYAAQAARQYFDSHPQAACFSIGMNDTAAAGFCLCAECRTLDPADPAEQKTPRGLPNYSNRFFTFANRVATELARTHPDKYLGCLAYHVTEPPPSFDVHPRIIPYLTAGRANWTDPVIRAGDQKLIRGWCKKVPVVGIYDYYYGSGFISPRIFTHLTEASLKFAHQAGVRAFYAEIYSTWSLDGPKAYVASQLLWDVNQNAEQLVDDFCTGLFGKAAAPMRAYFRFLEQRWMSRPGGSTVMWQGFFDPVQLEIWPPTACAEARRLLTQAETAASREEDTVQQRVKLFSDGFRQTELWSALYHGERSLRILADLEHFSDAQVQLERLNREVIQPSPLHRAVIAFEQRASTLPGGGLAGAVLRLSDQPQAQAMLERLASSAASTEVKSAARAALLLRSHPERVSQRLANPGFEPAAEKTATADARRTTPSGWGLWFRPGTPGQGESIPEAARSGKCGFVLRGAEAGSVLQSVPVQPGQKYLATVYVRGKLSPQAESKLVVQWKDTAGKWLTAAGQRGDRLSAGGSSDWTRLCVLVEVPPKAGQLVFCVTAYHQGPRDVLQIDDASLQCIPP
jgi:hypothetical protein